MFLEISQNSQKKTLLPEASNFINEETVAQVFSYEFCEISKNTFLTEHLWATASVCFSSKKNVITEKRYRVKFDSIKKSLLLIKQKQKNSKIPKRIRMKPCWKTRSDKSACGNIFLELPLTI